MTPAWHSPHPREGSKRRDKATVAEILRRVQPDFVGIPFGGLMGELQGWEGHFSTLCVADPDPGVSAILKVACTPGGLLEAGEKARTLLSDLHLDTISRDERIAAWKALRHQEWEAHKAGQEHTHLSIALGAGAIAGGCRRSKDGLFNQPTASHLNGPKRIAKREFLESAGTWMVAQQPSVYTDYSYVLSLGRGQKALYLVDPPYGASTADHYSGQWGADDLNTLQLSLCSNLAQGNSGAVIWCAVHERDGWLTRLEEASIPCDPPIARFARTAMKAAKKDESGNILRPARTSAGGWMILAGEASKGFLIETLLSS